MNGLALELSTRLVVLAIDLGPYFEDWVNGNYADAALGPFMPFAALFVVLIAFTISGGLAIYSRTLALPAIVGALFLGFASGYIPGLVARLGYLAFIFVAAALLYLGAKVFAR